MVEASPSVWRALDLYRGLILPHAALRRPYPHDMLTVITLAAGDEAVLAAQAEQTLEQAQTLRSAACCFLELVLTRAGNSDHGVLALNPGAAPDLIRAHKRALLKWLHPDRNRNAWQAALSAKVSAAAARLEKNEADAGGAKSEGPAWPAVERRRRPSRTPWARRGRRAGGQRSRPSTSPGARWSAVAAALVLALALLLQWDPVGSGMLRASLPGLAW